MVTGIIAAVTALFSMVVAWLGYKQRTAKTPTQLVGDVEKKIDDLEKQFEDGGGRIEKP